MSNDSARPFFPVIMTPTHDGKLFCNFAISLLNFCASAHQAGIPVQVYFHQGESLITRARNNCVAQFLANTEWTHLFWIDSDIGFSPQAALRLLNSGYRVCAGVYPLKREVWPDGTLKGVMDEQSIRVFLTRYTVNTSGASPSDDVNLIVQPDGFMKLREAPTGFMLIERSIFERLMMAYPELQYSPDSYGEPDNGFHYRFFDVMVDPVSRRYLSEDYGFCHLLKGIDEPIYVDACSSLTHQGFKTYRGDFASALEHVPSFAVGAPAGVKINISGIEFLKANDAPMG